LVTDAIRAVMEQIRPATPDPLTRPSLSRSASRSRRQLLPSRRFWWPIGLAAGVVAAVTASPWPGALLIRFVFGRDAAKFKAALEPHAPDDVRRIGNQRYGEGPDALLDVYLPASVADGEALPTIVWTHGGAWISGNKRDVIPYFAILASAGYTVVAPDYSVGLGRQYPTAVLQLNDALRYLHDKAERLHIDRDRIVLAGDSAGAQLTSQLAASVTNPDYARAMGITPALDVTQLKGLVPCCGVYNMAALDHLRGVLGWGFHIATWSYSGVRHYASDPALKLLSTVDYVTADFPAAFITGGNGDGLTAIQSKPLAAKLESLGVPTTALFFPDDYTPSLPHEYQFTLDTAASKEALERIRGFLEERCQRRHRSSLSSWRGGGAIVRLLRG